MVNKYQVKVTEPLMESLLGLATALGIDNIETLVDAILREKVYNVTGEKVPSAVSLMNAPSEDSNSNAVVDRLRKAVNSTGLSTFDEGNFGPDLSHDELNSSDVFSVQQKTISEQQTKINELSSTLRALSQGTVKGNQFPFRTRQG